MADRSRPDDSPTVALIGFMAAGKTTVARELDGAAIDADREIERRQGRSIDAIFAAEGEEGFRRIEEEIVLDLLTSAPRSGRSKVAGDGLGPVVSLGGGSVLSGAVREALGDCLTVWLDVDTDTAWRRSGSGEGDRPLARNRKAFEALHKERREIYRELADAVIPSGALPGSGSARRAAEAARIRSSLATLARLPQGTRLLWAISGRNRYPVFVGGGLISGTEGFGLLHRDEEDGALEPLPISGRRFLITDENVLAAVDSLRRRAGLGSILEETGTKGAESDRSRGDHVSVIPPGETAKTLDRVGELASEMAEAGFSRADHVAALGGGVVGDLAGFCAAVYQRGIPVVQLPTTVVAQVDSAYGGKTGVDLPAAKNYVGAYHQPAAVISDTALLKTLPEDELAAGFVEALKTGLLAGGRLWDAVREVEPRSAAALADHPFLVFDCAAFKLGVVAADERDGGLRQILNLGHTVGHAIETATEYRSYRHGEAVGLGLLAALRLSGADHLREEVETILREWGLPTRIRPQVGGDALTTDQLVRLIGRDKKRLTGETPFVLLAEPGNPTFGEKVPKDRVTAAVGELFE